MPLVRPYWNSVRLILRRAVPEVARRGGRRKRSRCRCDRATSKNSSYGRPAANDIASGIALGHLVEEVHRVQRRIRSASRADRRGASRPRRRHAIQEPISSQFPAMAEVQLRTGRRCGAMMQGGHHIETCMAAAILPKCSTAALGVPVDTFLELRWRRNAARSPGPARYARLHARPVPPLYEMSLAEARKADLAAIVADAGNAAGRRGGQHPASRTDRRPAGPGVPAGRRAAVPGA